MSVRVEPLNTEMITEKLSITGRTQASRETVLRAETSGKITEILVPKGTTVKKDQVLAKIEVKDRALRVKEAKENVARAEIEYNAAKSLSNKGFNSKIKLATTRTALESARTLLKQAEIDLANTEITAPYDGVLEEKHIEIGDFVSTGNPLLTVVDLDPMEAVAYVAEQNILGLKEGMPVSLSFLNDMIRTGEISFMASAAMDETRTFRIEMTTDNADYSIKDGLTVQIVIPVKEQAVHKILPSQLLLNDEGEVGIYVVDENNVVHFKPVTVIENAVDYTYIKKLTESEKLRLITVGQHFVKVGERVEAASPEKDGVQ